MNKLATISIALLLTSSLAGAKSLDDGLRVGSVAVVNGETLSETARPDPAPNSANSATLSSTQANALRIGAHPDQQP